MFMHNKRLMYTVRVSEPNPRLAAKLVARTMSSSRKNPETGTDLGAGPGSGAMTGQRHH